MKTNQGMKWGERSKDKDKDKKYKGKSKGREGAKDKAPAWKPFRDRATGKKN